jgi:hypothetical protein
MSLKDQLKNTQAQLDSVEQQTIPAGKVVIPKPARSYPSATMAFEGGTSFDPPTVRTNTSFRPMWKTPDVAIQQNKVITTKLPEASIAKGVTQSPQVTSTALTAMPDMSASVVVPGHSGDVNQGGGQVQISWQASASLDAATSVASFALYRDNKQIAPTCYGSNPNANGKFSVQQTFIDTPGNGLHVYAVYWATSAGTLTADSTGRFLHALALRPQ